MNSDKPIPKIGDVSKAAPKQRKRHYVNNPDFYAALVVYKAKCKVVEDEWKILYAKEIEIHKQNGLTPKQILASLPKIEYPRIPEYIGYCIYMIANKLSNSPNFCNYTYKDEMIADGIEDCILRIRSFDPEKSTNPFAYFTQTCYFASVRRIKKEKKQKQVKAEIVKNSGILSEMGPEHMDGDDGNYENSYLSFLLETVDHSHEAKDRDESTRKSLKKTTKAHQAKVKEQKELELLEKEREQFDILESEIEPIDPLQDYDSPLTQYYTEE